MPLWLPGNPIARIDEALDGSALAAGRGGLALVRAPRPPLCIDTFTDTAGTALLSHIPDAGGSWAYHPSYAGTMVITNANRVRNVSGVSLAYHSIIPASPDYSVTAQLTWFSGFTPTMGVAGRIDTVANTYYRFIYDPNSDTFKLSIYDAGTLISLGTSLEDVNYTVPCMMELKMVGSSISGLIDGVTVVGPVTNTVITAAGRLGMYMAGTMSNTSGGHLDFFGLPVYLEPTLHIPYVPPRVISREPPRPPNGLAIFAFGKDATPATPVQPARKPIVAQQAAVVPPAGSVIDAGGSGPLSAQALVAPRIAMAARHEPLWPSGLVIDPALSNLPPPPISAQATVQRPSVVAAPWLAPPQGGFLVKPMHGGASSTSPSPGPCSEVYVASAQTHLAILAGDVITWGNPTQQIPGGAAASGRITVAAQQPRDLPRGSVTVRVAAPPALAIPYPRGGKAVMPWSEPPRPPEGVLLGTGDLRMHRRPSNPIEGTLYDVYANTGVGDAIDYTAGIGTATANTFTTAVLTYPGTWMFGVRCSNEYGQEKNLDAALTLILDATGVDITHRPAAPLDLKASADAAGAIRLEWVSPLPPSREKRPVGFRVYSGTNAVNYGVVKATVPYSGATRYRAVVSGYTNGVTYLLSVRAYNATAEEPNTTTVAVTADSDAPTAIDSLTGTATGEEAN